MIPKTLAFIDIETTGLDTQVHEIIEFAGCVLGDRSKEIRLLIKPLALPFASEEALRINGFSEEKWKNAIHPKEAIHKIVEFLDGHLIAGHNVRFDVAFIEQAMKRWGAEKRLPHHVIDTVTLAYEHLVPLGLKSLSLREICSFLDISNDGEHQALIDVHRTMDVYNKIRGLTVFQRQKLRRSKSRGA